MALFPRIDPKNQAATNLALLEEVARVGLPADLSSISLDQEFLVPVVNIRVKRIGIPPQILRFADWVGYKGPGMTMPRVYDFIRSHRDSIYEDGTVIVFYTRAVFNDFVELLKGYILPTITGRSPRQLFPAKQPQLLVAPIPASGENH